MSLECTECGDEITDRCWYARGKRICQTCKPMDGEERTRRRGRGGPYTEAEAHRAQERRMRVIENGVNKGRKL